MDENIMKDLGMVTAYAYAVSEGYTGTEEEFAELMASYASTAEIAVDAALRAKASADEAKVSETASKASENAAVTSAGNAQTSAQNAAQSAADAQDDANAAALDASQALSAASQASTKAAEASQNASDAYASASAAQTAKTQAETAQGAAETAQEAAETAETNAKASETAAASSATSASNSATTATTKASEAAQSATDAGTSATNAANSATAASGSASTASTKASEAAQSATNAANSATAAGTAKTDAEAAKTAAQTAQTAAETAQGKAEDAQAAAEAAAQTLVIDPTLTQPNQAAEAKATGDAIGLVKSHLEATNDAIGNIENYVGVPFLITNHGGYLTESGTFTGASSFDSKTTDLIPCTPGEVYLYKGYANANAVSVLYYNANETISGFLHTSSVNQYTEITIPSGTVYVQFASCDAKGTTVVLDVYRKDSLKEELKDLSGEIDTLSDAVDTVQETISKIVSENPENLYNPANEQPNTVISGDGSETYNANYILNTEYIPCVAGQYVSVKGGTTTTLDGVVWLAAYRADKSYINRHSTQYGTVHTWLNDVSDCAFIRVVVFAHTTEAAVYVTDTDPGYTDSTFPYVPYGTPTIEIKPEVLPDGIEEALTSLDVGYRYTDLTDTAELFTTAYINNDGVITGSTVWNLFILQASEIPDFSELTIKSYTNLTSRYQVGFYSSAVPSDSTFISGVRFTAASSQNTLVLTELPSGTVSILVANLTASGGISIVARSAEEKTSVDDLEDDSARTQAFILKEQRARFDRQFNYIAYSAMLASGKGPNSEEQYVWGARRKFTAIKGDVRISSDGEIVMCHDEGFTLNGSGEVTAYDENNMTPIRNMTAAQCYALIYEGTTDHVCGLDALVRTCKLYGKIAFITVRSSYLDEIFPKIFECLDRYGMRDRAIINGFALTTMKKARKYDKDIMLSWVQTKNHKITAADVDQADALGNCLITCYDYSGADETKATNQSDTVLAYAQEKDIRVYEAIIGYDTDLNNAELYDRGFTGAQLAFEPEIFSYFT